MTEKEMMQVKVYSTEDGNIAILQGIHNHDAHVVIIHPEQADLLVKWINDVKKELQSD
ncbi:MAG: hypothetical protein QY317_16310 [Candidatus Jettenia caeni]|nr:MAG: hypothetical protein QY317_16310 [Candidatus Jettenia caeni]